MNEMRFRQLRFRNPTTRGATALLVLVAICAAAVPIPLGSVYRDAKDLSQPFPCQHCGCGCKNAEQCWTSCCCFSPAEKLAWAKENGVTPPSYAAQDVPQEAVKPPQHDTPRVARGCSKCVQPTAAASTTTNCAKCEKSAAKRTSCCASSSDECVADLQDDASGTECVEESETALVLSILALKCKGGANLYTHLPWAIVDSRSQPSSVLELLGPHVMSRLSAPVEVYLAPDVPPPRTSSKSALQTAAL